MIDRPRFPSIDTMPDILPVFPLPGVILLPGAEMPLNIFEPRYLNMVEDALGAGRMIGMIQPSEASSSHLVADGIDLYAIGCVGQISQFQSTDDGRYIIVLSGLMRFRIRDEAPAADGYRRVFADYREFEGDLLLRNSSEDVTLPDREALFASMRVYFEKKGIEADLDALEQASDQLLVTTLAMSCPFDVHEKQALLECEDNSARGELLNRIFDFAAYGDNVNSPLVRQ